MKTSRLLLLAVFVTGLLTGAGFWILRSHWDVPQTSAVSQPTGTDPSHPRSVRFYQSPMHPWIRSDRPGRCTICGMELTPVYEGDSGASAEGPVVVLGTNSIQLIHLETSEVSEAPLIRNLRLSGTLEDNDTRHRMIAASVAGRIERLSVNRLGQEIRAGDPLLTLYSPSLLAAEREYVALSKQPHPEPAGTSTDLTPILASARQRLIQMGLTPRQIDVLKDKSPSALTSELMVPADGTIVLKQVYEGQYVTEGERLFETADFSTMWVQLTAYESDRQWLRVGQSARITTASWNGGVITGQVSFIDPNFDPMTRSTRVRIEIPNPIEATTEAPRRRLLHRVTAMAEIACVETARTLPRSALLWNGGQPVVYLSLGAGAYESRKVRIGRIGDHLAEVLDGLKPGERVVTQAAFLIDAQSQLQSGGSGDSGNSQASSTSRNPSPVPPPLAGFLQHSADLSEALASDQLEVFREILKRFPPHQDALRHWATQPDSSLPETLQKSIASVPVPPASSVPASLSEARKWFLDQSQTTVELARWAHRQGWELGVRTFECPMVDRAIPSAPKRAGWLQKRAEVRNPFFGAEMIDCGLELKEKP